MKRRSFIQKTVASAAFATVALPFDASAAPKTRHLTVLHTNDVHSYIDPFPVDDPKFPNMGGVARRASIIESIRKENPNVLLLDAGDQLQGTPYFNYYGGELEYKLMSMMGYDLATIGNHEFDNGINAFYKLLPSAKFDFVSANYDFSNTVLDGIVKQYKIFKKGGIKIGVFGLGVELKGLVDSRNYAETVYLDPIEVAQSVVRDLKENHKCDIIICLSHIGFDYKNDVQKVSDKKLAAATTDIDLIIGGHTHTFLDRPIVIKNQAGKDVVINQVGCYGLNLGRIDFYLTDDKLNTSGRTIIV